MNGIDAKLAKWTALYEKLQDARSRLKVAEARRQKAADIREEIRDIERECGEALDEINAEYARMGTASDKRPDGSS